MASAVAGAEGGPQPGGGAAAGAGGGLLGEGPETQAETQAETRGFPGAGLVARLPEASQTGRARPGGRLRAADIAAAGSLVVCVSLSFCVQPLGQHVEWYSQTMPHSLSRPLMHPMVRVSCSWGCLIRPVQLLWGHGIEAQHPAHAQLDK